VRSVLAAMKPTQASLLLLRAEGLPYAQLAAALRLNPASVGTMLARAEARFKQEYKTRHGDH
jgi:RNA polymerase sigma-70 factor, ECF subfamily